jgi:hypothetical protein
VLADSLRTDRHAFRRLSNDEPVIVKLREWSRMTDDLQQERTRLASRMREQLWRYYPQMLERGRQTLRKPSINVGVVVGILSGPAHRADLVGEPANPGADRASSAADGWNGMAATTRKVSSANSASDEPSAAIRLGSSVGRAASRRCAAWCMSSGVKRSV